MAVYGCLLGYTLIADEMKDAQIKRPDWKNRLSGRTAGCNRSRCFKSQGFYQRSIGTAADEWQPAGYSTENRFGYVSESGIRFGETIKAYGSKAKDLEFIPLAIAGWCRYLLAVDDEGKPFELSQIPY